MSTTEKIRRRYNLIAPLYDTLEGKLESKMSHYRRQIIKELYGNVLETGAGTGKNAPYYPDNITVTAIDLSPKMLSIAEKKARICNKKVNFMTMDIENMKFMDNSFDCVFGTYVFCTVPNPVKGLREIKRVCKMGGKIVLLEHVRSENKLTGFLMDILNPVASFIIGDNMNRKTVENVMLAGFTDIHVENLGGDIVKKIIINNK